MVLDGLGGEQPEVRVVHSHEPNLELPSFEILPEHRLQTRDGGADALLRTERVTRILPLDLLLEEVDRLLLLGARARRLVTDKVPSRIVLEQRRPPLLVDADEHAHRRHRSHVRVLGVHLEPVRELAGEVVDGDLVAVLVAELRGGVARLLDDVADVGCDGTGGGKRQIAVCRLGLFWCATRKEKVTLGGSGGGAVVARVVTHVACRWRTVRWSW